MLPFLDAGHDCRRYREGMQSFSPPVFAAGAFISCGYFPGGLVGPADRLGPGLDLADDLDAPMAEIGRNLITDFGALDAAALPPSGETPQRWWCRREVMIGAGFKPPLLQRSPLGYA